MPIYGNPTTIQFHVGRLDAVQHVYETGVWFLAVAATKLGYSIEWFCSIFQFWTDVFAVHIIVEIWDLMRFDRDMSSRFLLFLLKVCFLLLFSGFPSFLLFILVLIDLNRSHDNPNGLQSIGI